MRHLILVDDHPRRSPFGCYGLAAAVICIALAADATGGGLAENNGVMLTGPLYSDLTADEKARMVDTNGSTFRRLSQKEKALLEEYRAAYVRMREFYSDLYMEVHEEVSSLAPSADDGIPAPPDSPLVLTRMCDYVFYARRGRYFRLDGTAKTGTGTATVRGTRIAIITPDESYLLLRSRSSGKYLLEGRGKSTDRYISDMLSEYWFPHAAFSCEIEHLEHLLLINRPHFVIEGVAEAVDAGERLVVASLSWRDGSARYVFEFYRDRCCALKEAREDVEIVADADRRAYRTQRCEYSPSAQGIPLLRACEVTHWTAAVGRGEERRIGKHVVYRVDRLNAGSPAASTFDVERLIGPIGSATTSVSIKVVSAAVSGALIVSLLTVQWIARRRTRREDWRSADAPAAQ